MWLKSAFISSYMTVAALAAAYVIYIADSTNAVSTVGALLAALPFLLMIGYFFVIGMARTSENLNLLLAAPVVGVVLTVFDVVANNQGYIQASVASLGLVGNFLYVFWYSRFGREKNTLLEVGKKLPDFELQTDKGEIVASAEFRKQPSLIMFYRGNWCPRCMAQIKEVAKMYQEMEKRGIKIYMVSPQSHGQTASLADRFDVAMNFLVDKDNKAAETLQIKAEGGLPMGLQGLGYDSDTVMPTVVMTDDKGEIIFADLTDNYRVRPEPEDFLRVFDEKMA